jgi:hypothetical protein
MTPERQTVATQEERPSTREAADEILLTPEVVKETFSTWEASSSSRASASRENADIKPDETVTQRATLDDGAGSAEASGAPGNFGDTPGLNEGKSRAASSSEFAKRLDAETEVEQPHRTNVETTVETQASHHAETDATLHRERTATDAPVKQRRRTVAVVEENLRPRVEKWRDASVGMLDDASEDSGLRFVIIALAMFFLFLLFLVVGNFLK